MEIDLFGAHCLLCYSKRNEWKDIQKTEYGFPIERTAKGTVETYQKMLEEYGGIKKFRNDYDTRKGLTPKPLSEDNQHFITTP
ncbi:unnamed protein product [Didymodactylos carnosus]|uniref:Uncharacterized protein n=1 Tax=Didymodactylos carnosus TaxID=1234261 RepID=A0A813UHC1_9BILA|nr:unnamed protein product [Didymodactylos carnosus]CAF1328211.1 unnamed protein product [Didymodactylos carnosus]CAF3613802.1 unnamed protein product [Didymodactylos carnosus]CAF4139569.1 unnamed protein product [Didymodactylos carnosus]